MTTSEHLERIVAKCKANLALAEENAGMYCPQAEAGWKATIAAIEWIHYIRHSEGPKGTHEMCNAILAAWPEELL